MSDCTTYICTTANRKKGGCITETSIGLQLRSLNNLIKRYFDNYTHKQMVDSITGTNGWIIGFLGENADRDIYQKDLEKKFSITRSTASKVLNLMEQKGLIKRQSVSHDARLKKIVLTQKAWEINGIMRQDAENMEKNLVKGFSTGELETLNGYLQRMKENIADIH